VGRGGQEVRNGGKNRVNAFVNEGGEEGGEGRRERGMREGGRGRVEEGGVDVQKRASSAQAAEACGGEALRKVKSSRERCAEGAD
jgi:hypothetical protein